ncbi:MAG: CHASE2 domain-containing protein, partial [Woeseiaceae bacterium]|nr:CHASE2 domain-containing protein [Woeseiaceae bacterium]
MDLGKKQKRNRLIALSFASVLLLLIYGPLAQWFVVADRLLYDTLASNMPTRPLDDAVIISLDPSEHRGDELLDRYGKIMDFLHRAEVRRIVLPAPPEVAASEPLPAWTNGLGQSIPVYVPINHRFAELRTRTGFMNISPDSDGVLRRSELWQLSDGVMSPSLPLAIAFDNDDSQVSHRMSSDEDAIYLSNYPPLRRLDPDDIIDGLVSTRNLVGYTVFVDSEPELVGAQGQLPSGQFVTSSEIVATLLANVEQDRAIIAPSWVGAMEWLAPVLLAIIAVLFMPDRTRRDIAVLTIAVVAGLLLIEAMILFVLQTRLDLGRPIVIFIGVSLLSIWLIEDESKLSSEAFKRGSDFLAAGRLEPAFAEFRQCPPSETLASYMYKLSLAFEEQAKPERAEAVLEWLKRTHGSIATKQQQSKMGNGLPQRPGRYVIEKRIGRGAMG